MRKVNRLSRFPARPWINKYKKLLEPKLKSRAFKAIEKLDSAGVLDKFVAYLREQYPGWGSRSKAYTPEEVAKAFSTADDADEFNKLIGSALDGLSWDVDKIVEEMTGRIFQASSKHSFGKMGLSLEWNIKSPAVERATKARQNFIKDVGRSQFNELKDMIRNQCYTLGGSAVSPHFLEQLRKTAGKRSQDQAERIARTETCNIHSAASKTVFKANKVSRKEWIHSGSEYDRHKGLDGEVVGIDEAFSNGQQHPGDDTGDPGDSINCLCAMGPVFDDDFTLDEDEAVTE